MRVVLDCFMFYNEIELLKVRLNELWDVVDYFVLVEATKTHSGFSKPLYFDENKLQFYDYNRKIWHVIVDNMPIYKDQIEAVRPYVDGKWVSGDLLGDIWVRERFQRDSMMQVLSQCDPDDIIIIEDADEMVRASIVNQLYDATADGLVAIEQSLHSYYLNWKCTNMPWHGTKVVRKRDLTTPSRDRFHTKPTKVIKNGGWHFSFMGGADKIKQKIHAYAHPEFDVPEVLNNIDAHLQNKTDALGRLYQYEIVPIDESYPWYIQNNLDLFDTWIDHNVY